MFQYKIKLNGLTNLEFSTVAAKIKKLTKKDDSMIFGTTIYFNNHNNNNHELINAIADFGLLEQIEHNL